MTTPKPKPEVPTSLTDPSVKAIRETLLMSWQLIDQDIDNCCQRYKELLIIAKGTGYTPELTSGLIYWQNQGKNARAYKSKLRGLMAGISQTRPDSSFPLVGWQRAAKEAKRITG